MHSIFKQLKEISSKHDTLWFRGHSSCTYKLNSGLYRINSDLDEVRQFENQIYNAFINYGDFFSRKFYDNKEWNALFMMQHYGLYTRLLDWTSSFSTALYFANLNRNHQKDAVIWAIDPIELNRHCYNLYEHNHDEPYDSIGLITIETLPNRIKKYTNFFNEDIHIKTFAIMPRRNNDRLVSQSGFFTVQGTEGKPLEHEYEQFIDKFIYKIVLPANTFEESMEYLRLNGINYYSIFGGIDGLCKYIKDELLQIKLNNL